MPIDLENNQAVFSGVVSVEDVEALSAWLQETPAAKASLAACSHLHPANLQVLLADKTRISAWPEDENLRAWLTSVLQLA